MVREIGERSLREIAERTGVHYDLVTDAAEEVIKETDLIAVTKQGKTGFDELIKKIGERVAAKNLDGIVISQKIVNDYASRGWNEELIRQVIKSPFTTRKAQNKANGNRATAYYQKDGSYVSVDDITKEVIQVSKIGDETWVPDSTIIDPYKP